jgi:hypothetical protein
LETTVGDATPRRWLDTLELRDEIDALAGDLLTGYEDTKNWWKRYPGTSTARSFA